MTGLSRGEETMMTC